MDTFPLDKMFTRDEAAAALSELGYPTTPAVLATLASRGGGPSYHRFGKRVIYRGSDLVTWAEARCTWGPCNSTESNGRFEFT
jgi:hypothetical protein